MKISKSNLDLNLLTCFKVVAEKGSISHASSILHLSQPAISLQIKRLEEQIGKKLFDRHNRGLFLTKFGDQFLEKTHRLLEIQNDLIGLVEHSDSEPSGQLRIGTYTTASSYLIAPAAASYLKQFKDVSLFYAYNESKFILEQIKDYRLDCAILTDVPADKNLDIERFYKDELVFAISTQRKESKLKNISAQDLVDFDFLSYPLRYDLCYKTVETKFGTYLSKSRTVVETESFDTLKQMLLLGSGATFIPKYLIAKELQNGKLSTIQIGQTKLPIEFAFISKKNTELPKRTKRFKETLLKFFPTPE